MLENLPDMVFGENPVLAGPCAGRPGVQPGYAGLPVKIPINTGFAPTEKLGRQRWR
jgi:hypothetical protein